MRTVILALLALLPTQIIGSIASVKLNNGVDMPMLSFGANVWDTQTCKQATGDALKAGFRFIWSSMLVKEPCQRAQTEAIQESGIPRAELFIAGTVNTQTCMGFEQCYGETLGLGYSQLSILADARLDMLMLDYPSGAGCQGILGQWKAFEDLYKAGKAKVIAVSNFGPSELQCLMGSSPGVVPAVNQMRVNAGLPPGTVVADNARYGIAVQAYAPLGSGGLASDILLTRIGKAHGKSSVQVALRWLIQQGISANLASTSFQHLSSDVQVFDFTLSSAEMHDITMKHTEASDATRLVAKFSMVGGMDRRISKGGFVFCIMAVAVGGVLLAFSRRVATDANSFSAMEE